MIIDMDNFNDDLEKAMSNLNQNPQSLPDYIIPSEIWERFQLGSQTSAEHEQYCLDGYVELDNTGMSTHCPICQAKNQYERMMQRLENAGVPKGDLSLEFDSIETDLDPAFDRCKFYAKHIRRAVTEGQNLLLFGKYGRGKTTSATLIAKAAARAGYSVNMHNVGRLAVEIRSGYGLTGERVTESSVLKNDIEAPDLLILDDLGAAETDSLKIEKRILFLGLDARHKELKPTILTSNLNKLELVAGINDGVRKFEGYGSRIFNRLMPLTEIEFNHGKNFRGEQHKDFC